MSYEIQGNGAISHKFRLNTKVSLVVCPVDDLLRDGTPTVGLRVFLKEHPSCPTKNLSGYYVFTDLPDGTYTVCIASDHFFFAWKTVELNKLDPSQPVVRMVLKPNPLYPYPLGSTLVRGALKDREGGPASGAEIRATILTGSAARLSSKGSLEGEKHLELVDMTRRIYVGDVFLINDEYEESREYCSASDSVEGVLGLQGMKLESPLIYKHGRGTQVLHAVETTTDEKGEFAVYFRNVPAKKFAIRLETGRMGISSGTEIQVVEGAAVSLGFIGLT